MEPEELAWLYDQATRMQTIVEIGSWQGRSTTVLCHACPGTVFAIDHWRPNDYQTNKVIRDGWDIPASFKRNLKEFIDSGKLVLIQSSSLIAAKNPLIPTHPDMIFLDGDHDYINVRRDLHHWAPRARILICGHDYDPEAFSRIITDDADHTRYLQTKGHPGVKKAVDEYFEGRAKVTAKLIWAHFKMVGVSH